MLKELLLSLSVLSIGSSAFGGALETLWEKDPLWEFTADSFASKARELGFRWTSAQKDSARSSGPDLKFGDIPLVEAVARFERDKISSVTLQLYTRGDAGDLAKADYEALLKKVTELVTARSQAKPETRGKDASNSVRAEGIVWQGARTTWVLEYSSSREMTPQGVKVRPEFVRLELTPAGKKTAEVKQAAPAAKVNPKQRVKNLSNGDVFLEGIPMVDQGDKGYCFPASAERVLRSYGMKVDQNELAQLAGNQGGGTSLRGGLEGLKTAGNRLQFRVKMVDEPDIREFEKLVKEYNWRVLKYGQKAQIPPLQGTIDMDAILTSMRPDALRAARLGMKPEKARFLRSLEGSISAGHPIIWGVLLGLAPEKGLEQVSGGHARLIVGFNSKTNECLYSDSWGAGHELKRMSFDDAWMIHQFSFLLIPSGVETPTLSQERSK